MVNVLYTKKALFFMYAKNRAVYRLIGSLITCIEDDFSYKQRTSGIEDIA